jgi:hypothetical protein
VKWTFHNGLRCADPSLLDEKTMDALGVGAQREQYAHWCLRQLGYIRAAIKGKPA